MLVPDRDIHGIIEFKGGEMHTTKIDAVFPILHGKNGEDGSVQGLLELAGIPIIGCGMLASALCMDKARAKKLVEYAGIKSSASCVIAHTDQAEIIYEKMKGLAYPVFVKPVKSGSSIGITKVYKEKDLMGAIEDAFKHDNEVIVEENVEGVEVGCAVIGNNELLVGEVDEIELDVDWFDYYEKYTQKKSKIHMPARINSDLAEKIKGVSKDIYRALGCSGFARVDLFLTKDGEILFNEVNTIPGLTSHSRFPKMMRGAGYEFPELLNKLISLGVYQ
jgi:D-alanine---D-serine ligase